MKDSIGYTVTINIIIIFIIIIFAFLSAAIIYYKSNKIGNVITSSIEKYEGFNELAQSEIERNMSSLGYNKHSISCPSTTSCSRTAGKGELVIINKIKTSDSGYCVYLCNEGDYYYYKIKTNMMINIPIINDVLNLPIFTTTNRLYDFETNLK